MKENEAPEKIYFSGQQQWSNPFIGLTQKCADTDIEYTRTDAFIKKTEEFLYEKLNSGEMECGDIIAFIEDLKNYIKYMLNY